MNEEQLQQAFIQFLAQKHGVQSQQELETLIQQLGEEGLQQEYAEFMQLMQQQQAQVARHGAKLNYINQLRGKCPEGYEMQYFKAGGRVCKKCMKKSEPVKPKMQQGDAIEEYKCGRKMKKKEQGGNVEMDKCSSKMKKAEEGSALQRLPRNNGSFEHYLTPIRGAYFPAPTTDVSLDNGAAMGYVGPTKSTINYEIDPGYFYGTRPDGTEMTENEAKQYMRESFQPAFRFGVPGYYKKSRK